MSQKDRPGAANASAPIKVLYIDDNPHDRALVRDALEHSASAFALSEASTEDEFNKLLSSEKFDLILSDFNILGFDGLEVLDAAQEKTPDTPVIIITGTGSEEIAVTALGKGAAEYIIKTPRHIKRLPHALVAVFEKQLLLKEHRRKDQEIRQVKEQMERVIAQNVDGMMVLESEGTVIFANPAAGELLGVEADGLVGSRPGIPLAGEEIAELEIPRGSEGLRCVEMRTTHLDWQGQDAILAALRDVTARNRALGQSEHLNKILQSIRYVNQLIVHEKDRDRLLEKACASLVKTRGYSVAWVALFDEDGGVISSAACGLRGNKDDLELLIKTKLPPCAKMAAEAPALEVISVGDSASLCNNCSLASAYQRSEVMACCLARNGHCRGVIVVSLPEGMPANEDEQELFTEMAGDIAFGLGEIELSEAHRRSKAELARAKLSLEEAQSIARVGSWHYNVAADKATWSKEMFRIFGLGQAINEPNWQEHQELIHPDDWERIDVAFKGAVFRGLPYSEEFRIIRPDKKEVWAHTRGTVIHGDAGDVIYLLGTVQDITERKEAELELRQFEWLIEKESDEETTRKQKYKPPYSDLTQLNTSRLILDSLGKDALHTLAQDLMDLLDTSVAIYEKNGDYAYGFFKSAWCSLLDHASFNLCGTSDAKEALRCGKWLCHENCWNDSAKAAIATGLPTDIACVGGIRLFAAPIISGGEVIGALNIGYGTPPMDQETTMELAELFKVDPKLLKRVAQSYKPRPEFIMEVAKKRCISAAKMIGEIVDRKRAERELLNSLEQTRSRTMELEALLKASTYVLEESTFQLTARAIFDVAREVTGARSGYIALLSETGQENDVLFLESGGMACGVDPDLPMPVRGLRAEAYHSGCTVFDNDFMNGSWAELMPSGHVELRNVLFAPLNIYGQTVGVMGLANKPGNFTEDDIRMATAFGQLAALALQNSRSREDLADSERNYRLLADNTLDAIWTMDLELRFTYINPAVFEMLGFTPEEWVGSSLWEHCDEENFQLMAGIVAEELRKGPSSSGVVFEAVMLKKDGSPINVEIHWKAIFDDEGRLSFLQGITRDITGRKKMQDELERTAHRKRLALKSSNVGLWDWEIGKEKLYLSPEWMSQIGYEAGELPSTYETWEERLHPDDRERIVNLLNDYLKREVDAYRPEFRFRHKDGSYRWIASSAEALWDAHGKPYRMTGCHLDITEQRTEREKKEQLEERLAQAHRMEAIGRLAGGVAHDFNNALTPLLMISNSLMTEMPADHPFREDIREIREAGDRCASLTRQLLAFSRKQTLEMVELNPNKVILNVKKLLHRIIGEDINMVMELRDEAGEIRADVGQLEQIIVNLAVNARDAMPRGGNLTIETANARLTENEVKVNWEISPGEYVMIAIHDSGYGMDKETTEKIFEPFFTTKEQGKGTGLGLSTVYGIVKQSNGHITCHSKEGEGTTFRIYLPRVEGTSEQIPKRTIRPRDNLHGSETVLLVEDDPGVREAARRIFEKSGYNLLVAEDGKSALRIVEEYPNPIHIMVTDVVMPGMSGKELSDRLSPKYPDMKVLYMSGYMDEAIEHHGVINKGLHIAEKPFTRDSLLSKVRSVLDN